MRHVRQQRVDHRVADEENPVVRNPGAPQVLVGHSLVVKNQLVMESVTSRLISSGIDQSPERMPPSTCATGTRLLRGDGAGHGGGDVAYHEAEVASLFQQSCS